jgi:8-oxo-dGTP pyrophosphatase MutT (NUDIX family)
MTDGHWKLIESRILIENHWIRFSENKFKLPDATVLERYYILERDDFVLVIARRDSDDLVLVRQFRPATQRFYLSVPAGYLARGEDPVTGAARELLEETGFIAKDLKLIACFDPLPGYIRSRAYVVTCRVYHEPTTMVTSSEEISEVLLVPVERVEEMVLGGEIDEMQAACAILFYAKLRRRENGGHEIRT